MEGQETLDWPRFETQWGKMTDRMPPKAFFQAIFFSLSKKKIWLKGVYYFIWIFVKDEKTLIFILKQFSDVSFKIFENQFIALHREVAKNLGDLRQMTDDQRHTPNS